MKPSATGLEGDFNRKKTPAFAGLMGQQVARAASRVVDDGTISARRGSLSSTTKVRRPSQHRADRGRHPCRLCMQDRYRTRAADEHEGDCALAAGYSASRAHEQVACSAGSLYDPASTAAGRAHLEPAGSSVRQGFHARCRA